MATLQCTVKKTAKCLAQYNTTIPCLCTQHIWTHLILGVVAVANQSLCRLLLLIERHTSVKATHANILCLVFNT